MDNWNNILNEDVLKFNINFAALFVLNFECLKDYIITQPRTFYSDVLIKDGELCCEETEEYKKEVRSLEKNIENASLRWFMNTDAITEEDYNLYQELRERRNDITHELLKNLNNGFNETDAKLYVKLLELYQKIDKWWINEIEIPISGEVLPDEYDSEQVLGGQAMILSIINDIIFDNNKERYKNLLDELKKLGIV
ncbi:hypothetical protein [Acetatifactor aquisgranensis]|uniref:hypothetical protein n=1 Tax=Acetatifactor aquisgranensis TaxID=2941233 RepID=UPI00203F799D|nr:hypothetical protein [Acetatifactor aquisgranensis]MDE7321739.1 hypothetical protein [Lachnospiraceae bacterium]